MSRKAPDHIGKSWRQPGPFGSPRAELPAPPKPAEAAWQWDLDGMWMGFSGGLTWFYSIMMFYCVLFGSYRYIEPCLGTQHGIVLGFKFSLNIFLVLILDPI